MLVPFTRSSVPKSLKKFPQNQPLNAKVVHLDHCGPPGEAGQVSIYATADFRRWSKPRRRSFHKSL